MTTGDPLASPETPPAGPPRSRMRQSIRDMVLSMAVVLAVVAGIVLVTVRPHPDPVRVVDTAPVVAMAAAQADFPVTAPAHLPEGWRPTSARWEPTAESGDQPVLHIGYVTPSEQYAQVTQSLASSGAYVAEQTGKGIATGHKDIGGTDWESWEGNTRRSLLRTVGGLEIIVSGSAPWEELGILAASLQAVPSAPAASSDSSSAS